MHVRAEPLDVMIAILWSSRQGQFSPDLPGRWFVPDRKLLMVYPPGSDAMSLHDCLRVWWCCVGDFLYLAC